MTREYPTSSRSRRRSTRSRRISRRASFPPIKEFENVYFNMSTGDGETRGPWNKEPTFEYREAQPAVDGGDGLPQVKVSQEEAALLRKAAARLKSDMSSDPMTGAMLGADGKNTGEKARKGPQKPAHPDAPSKH